jgi:hypothetical protein
VSKAEVISIKNLIDDFILLTSFSTPEEESQSVELAKLKGSLQRIDGEGAVVPAVQLTHLLSYASIAVHQYLGKQYNNTRFPYKENKGAKILL